MNKKLSWMVCGLTVLSGFVAASADTLVLSGNYCSVAPIVNFPAGLVPVANWNDLTGPAGFGPNASKSNPIYSDGSVATGTTISWTTSDGGSQNTNDYVVRPMSPNTLGNHIDDGHDQLMTGYLQASKYSSSNPIISLQASNLNVSTLGGSYDLIVYFDGDDDVESNASRAQFRVWNSYADYTNSLAPLATYYGRDKVGNNFAIGHTVVNSLADYSQITSTNEFSPTEGNYVKFSGLTSPNFYMQMVGVAGQHGVAMNGFQIVAVPEPTSLALLAAIGGGWLARRKK